MYIKKIPIKSKLRDYCVYFVDKPDFISKLKSTKNSLFIVDTNVWDHHKDDSLKALDTSDLFLLPISEERKILKTIEEIYDYAIAKTPKKNLTVVSIGGGITQDITGFFASTLYRGVNWIFVPTTLLAQADSCVGGKTSLNYKNYKNLIGTFYPPFEIYIYPHFLETQDNKNYLSGLGEVAKLCLIGGEKHTQYLVIIMQKLLNRDSTLLLEAVQTALYIKKSYIEEDEFDTGRRNMLNYGHCMGHALESATDFAVSHGQAVVFGMLFANIVAQERGILSAEKARFFAEKILIPILGTSLKDIEFDKNMIIQAMKQDKKRTGAGLALVMIQDNYEMIRINDLAEKEAFEALVKLEKILKNIH